MIFRFANPLLLILLSAVPIFAYFQLGRSRRETGTVMPVALRSLVIVLLVIAMSGVEIAGPSKGTTVIFVADRSNSVAGENVDRTSETIREMTAAMQSRDSAGIIAFGADTSIEQTVSPTLQHERFESIIDPGGTNIEAAIIRGLATFSEGGGKKLVLFSDGVETIGSALNAAAVAARLDVEIDVVPLFSDKTGVDASITGVSVPTSVNTGQIFDLTAFVWATDTVKAWLYIVRDGVFLGEDELELTKGENTFTYTTMAMAAGEHRYQLFLEPETDAIADNNVYNVSLRVRGEPRILYVSNPVEPSRALLAALSAQDISAEVIAVEELPSDLTSLLLFDAVLFDDIPAFDLSFEKMELIERYVRDLGGGFLMLGGDSSFGLGGYFNTPVERILPVDMDVTSSMNTPSLALMMIVDKSGSMGDTIASGETKLDLVKEAVIASVEVLNPFYTVGLLSFDADFEWTIPPVRAGDREQIVTRLSKLAPGGGTRLFPAMEAGYRELAKTEAAVKHMLILSDGLTDDGEFEALVSEIADERITISTIAVGSDSDRELLEMIADKSDGRSYFTDDIEKVPRIFASESIIVSRGLIVEERFFPQPEDPSDITEGIDLFSAPPLDGFVLAYTKPSATQIMTTFNGNPLLAAWQFGLGRSAAFTSDMKGRWGSEWLAWSEFPRFAAQLVRWLQRPTESENLEVTMDISRSVGYLTVDAVNEEGDFINGRTIETVILYPDGTINTQELTQTQPGRYETTFPASDTGEYYASVFDTGVSQSGRADSRWSPVSASFSVPYSPEYLPRPPDVALLDDISALTGGKILSSDDVPNVFANDRIERVFLPIWRFLIILALIVFVADIGYRQITFTDAEGSSRIQGTARRQKKGERISYRDMIDRIERGYHEDASNKRDLSYWFGRDAELREANKRLYLSKRKRS